MFSTYIYTSCPLYSPHRTIIIARRVARQAYIYDANAQMHVKPHNGRCSFVHLPSLQPTRILFEIIPQTHTLHTLTHINLHAPRAADAAHFT